MTSLQTPPLSAEQAAPDSRALRLVRILLPIAVLAAGTPFGNTSPRRTTLAKVALLVEAWSESDRVGVGSNGIQP